MEYKENSYIIYDPRVIGTLGIQAKDLVTDQIRLFRYDNIVHLKNWQHKVDGEYKNVFIGTKFERLEQKITNFGNLD